MNVRTRGEVFLAAFFRESGLESKPLYMPSLAPTDLDHDSAFSQ
jgi:hypothetical protein